MKRKILLAIITFYTLSSFSQSIPSYVPTASLEAWYSFTGNSNDMTAHGHNLTNSGATLTTDRCGNLNCAYLFDGSSSFMSSTDAFFDNGWPNYSISLWLSSTTASNPNNNNHSQTMFNTLPHYGTELSYSWGADNKYDFFYNSTASNTGGWSIFSNNNAESNSNVVVGDWVHLVLVKSDTTYKMYVNGSLNNTFTNPRAAVSYLCSIYIGTISGGYAPETFSGALDDYGIWSRSLTDAEVLQLFLGNCNSSVPSCIPMTGLVAYYPFDGNTYDATGNGHDMVNSGAPLTTDRCGNANSAYAFDGNTTFMTSVDTFFDNGWPNYSICLWFNTDTDDNPYNHNSSQTMFNTEPHYGSEISMSWGGTTDKVDYFYNTQPSTYGWDIFSNNNALSNSTIRINKWTHVALVKSDTTYQMYINGVLDNTFTSPAVAISYLCQIYIGNISDNQPETFWGSLDDYGIWNRSLSASEVLQVYNGCCTALAVNDVAQDHAISIYPNPANDVINITGAQTGSSYTISDITGRIVMNGATINKNSTISIEALAPSIYMIQVGDKSFKFVKN